MADKKKVFSIVINGVKESTDAVAALNEKLKETEGIIDRLKNVKVDVKVSAGETKTAKVSGKSGNDADKVALEIEKEKTKQLQMQNDELREQYIQREQLKQANKEALQEIKDQAKGYAEINDGVKTYANTMNGMKAELRDIKAELHNTELGSEEFENLTLRAAQLNEQLKELEFAYGQYGRNVGNYTNSWIEAMEEVRHYMEADFGETTEITLEKLQDMSKGAQAAFKNMTPDNANYEKVKDDIAAIGEAIAKMKEQAKGAGDEMARLSEGISVSIDGVEYKFKSVEEAMGDMRKRLYEMKIAGQENTPVFQQLMQKVQDFQREVATTNSQIQAMAKTSSSISNVISVFKGVSGIAAMGQGLMGLFGGKSEELDKMIQKFAAFTLVLQGINTLQDEISLGNSRFGKSLQYLDGIFDNLFSKVFGKGQEAVNQFTNALNISAKSYKAYADNVSRKREINTLVGDLQAATGHATELNMAMKIFYKTREERRDFKDSELKTLSNRLDKLKQQYPEVADKIDKLAEKLKESRKVSLNLAETDKEYLETIEKMSPAFSKLTGRLTNFMSQHNKLGKVIRFTFNAFANLFNLLKMGLKMFAGTAALMLFAEAIEWVTKCITDLYTRLKEEFGIMSEDSAKKLTEDINQLGKALDSLNKEIDIKIKVGNLGEVEGQITKLKNELDALDKITEKVRNQRQMRDWINQIAQIEKTSKAYEGMSDAEKKAVEGLEGLRGVSGDFFYEFSGDSEDMETKLQKIDKKLASVGVTAENLHAVETIFSQGDDAIEEFLDKLQKTEEGASERLDVFGGDLDDIGAHGAKAFNEWVKAILKLREETANVVAKMKGDLDSLQKQEWSLRLSIDAADVDARKAQFQKEWKDIFDKYGLTLNDIVNGTGNAAVESMKAIAQQLKTNYELAQQLNDKAIADAQKKKKDDSDKKAKDALKKLRAEENARLELLQEGLDKEIAILEQKRKEELQDADETGKSRATINAIYDKRILEAKKKFLKSRNDLMRENAEKVKDIERQLLADILEMQRRIEDTTSDTSMGNNENQNISIKKTITYDTNTTGNDNVNAQKEYYDKLLQEDVRYINEKEKLEVEAAQREHQRQIEDENARFNAAKEANQKELLERERSLEASVEAGIITEEEAAQMLHDIHSAQHAKDEELRKQHYDNLAAITKHGEEVITNIHNQAEDERQQATMDALNNMMAATQDFYNDIDKVMERAQKSKTNSAGFINYNAYRKSIKDALDSTKQAAQQIEAEKKRLQDALNNKQISFDDFSKAMKQLDQFSKDVQDKAKELQKTLASSFNTWLGNMMQNVNQYTSVLSGMFDVISEMYTRELDAQEAALDKKQELLDKELEMIEEQYDKQQELTQQHKDKINDTENELKNARGDRRQALIDSMAAERKSMEESIKKERKLTDEKKKNAQKQEQLKKEQEAIEKKRRQQEKRAAIVQATIQGLVAINSALSLQPFYVGLAMAALATAMTTANIASIASQQYADGGLLNGKSHAQGGMRIQGTNMEVEGGEYVTNKATTAQNLPLLEYINSSRKRLTKEDLIKFYDNGKTTLINKAVQSKFAEGGRLPQLNVNVKDLVNNVTRVQDDRPIVVSVVDVINAADDLRAVQTLAGVGND